MNKIIYLFILNHNNKIMLVNCLIYYLKNIKKTKMIQNIYN